MSERVKRFAVAIALMTAMLVAVPRGSASTVTTVAAGALVVLPASVTVGGSYDATLFLSNDGNSGIIDVCNAGGPGPCSSTQGITVIPSCGQTTAVECTQPDPGVFELSANAVGALGSACAGMQFDVALVDATTGARRFTPAGGASVILHPQQVCRISFTLLVLKHPTIDASPEPGLQTLSTLDATFRSPTSSARARGQSRTTFEVGTPTITTTASSGINLGGSVTDTAVVSGRVNPQPGATVSFRLYGPGDTDCTGTPVFQNLDVPYPVAGGPVTSAAFTPTAADTYRWIATYSGDANNFPAAGACNEEGEDVVVRELGNPTLATQASAGGMLGTPVRDVATLTGGLSPTGVVRFELFADPSCATHVFGSMKPLSAGTATSDWFVPTAPGTYYWTALYSGDAANSGAVSGCNAPNESVTIRPFAPPVFTRTITGDLLGPLTVRAGDSVRIVDARLTGPVTVEPGGALTVENSRITRGLVADNPAFLSVCGSQVSSAAPAAALSVGGATVPVRIGDPANGCSGNWFGGPVSLNSNLAVTFKANTVSGGVTVNGGGPGNTVIGANSISATLACSANNPAPTSAGQPNTAGAKTGQCTPL